MKKISGIYCIRNTKNNKIYIGSAVNIYGRWATHRHNLNHNKHCNPHLQRAWNLNKQYFIFEILVITEQYELIELEQRFMNLYGLPNDLIGYNLREKAKNQQGLKHSEKTKKKISDKSKQLWKDTNYRNNIISHLKRNGQKSSKPIICLETQNIYNSITEAAKANKLEPGDVCASARLFCKFKGKSYRYLDHNNKPIDRPSKKQNKLIKCLQNNIIYNSCEEAARQLKIKGGGCSVSRQARGILKTVKGYTFQFIREDILGQSTV
jgi:group I intron endonuclease